MEVYCYKGIQHKFSSTQIIALYFFLCFLYLAFYLGPHHNVETAAAYVFLEMGIWYHSGSWGQRGEAPIHLLQRRKAPEQSEAEQTFQKEVPDNWSETLWWVRFSVTESVNSMLKFSQVSKSKAISIKGGFKMTKGCHSREMKLIPSILSARTRCWSRQFSGLVMPYRWKQGLGLEMVFEQARNSMWGDYSD